MDTCVIEDIFFHNGLKCMIVFTPLGHRCGYVGVSITHKLYQKNYYDECIIFNEMTTPENYFNCHGNITFSGVIEEDEDNNWFFGFDCAHLGDLPDIETGKKYGYQATMLKPFGSGTVKTLEFAREQCKLLADQLCNIH